ncbi:hypothetical protein VKT23_019830 [Stygiomarasmius scandens]|uniref:RBR-type E3 ubiquitin transferase n=1 Tax=Marasmiellus scandens TaxID=2682957 RepID=A0ABR1IP97_9AGAR
MSFDDIDAATSLLIAQLTLHDIEEYNRNAAGRSNATLDEDDEQYAFRLLEEEFEMYLQERGVSRDRREPSSEILEDPQIIDSDSTHSTDSDETLRSTFRNTLASAADLDWSTPSVPITGLDRTNPSVPKIGLLRQPLNPNYIPPECIVCAEPVILYTSFTAPCGHYYCQSCLEDFVNTSIKDETSFPPQCCQKPFPLGLEPSEPSSSRWSSFSALSVSSLLSDLNLVRRLDEKSREFSVPARDRLYCPNSQCSIFFGSLSTIRIAGPVPTACYSCNTVVCLECKQINHPGTACPPSPEEVAETQVRELAKEQKWQTCPGCKQIVERTEGCPHMVCRCEAQFCYGCGSDWQQGTGCTCGQQPAPGADAVRFRPIPAATPPRPIGWGRLLTGARPIPSTATRRDRERESTPMLSPLRFAAGPARPRPIFALTPRRSNNANA